MTKEEILEALVIQHVELINGGKFSSFDRDAFLKSEEAQTAFEGMEQYAKQEAALYFKFKRVYQQIESMNVKHYCELEFNGGMISTIGASDDKIWEAYKKGEQIKSYLEK